ncbi:MAG: shikimate dehydrogenase [Bacillota bacterium]|nr:shikimate dehydrogenase [Bacillota bacterium]MDW7677224.1 shikimate dehydrogenase [Bacillota bacterium]
MEKNRITGTTRLTGLLGSPVRHSKSPHIHNTAFQALGLDYVYMVFEVAPDSLQDAIQAMKTLDVAGFNLTMPHKQKVIPMLDELSPEARISGAVNTVKNENGKLTGYNTDGKGFIMALSNQGIEPAGKKCVMLGAGGAGKSIAIQLALDGAAELVIFNRSAEPAESLCDLIGKEIPSCRISHHRLDDARLKEELSTAAVLVNTTNVGMEPQAGESLITDPAMLPADLFVAEIIYYPAKTRLMEVAEAAGCRTINGLDMLIGQAALAFNIWTGADMPTDVVKQELST